MYENDKLGVILSDSILKFMITTCKLILKSRQSTHAKDLMMLDDFVIDYDREMMFLCHVLIFHNTELINDRLTSNCCLFGSLWHGKPHAKHAVFLNAS